MEISEKGRYWAFDGQKRVPVELLFRRDLCVLWWVNPDNSG